MNMRRRKAGYTLIEVIVTLVLVGILSVFAGLFMNTFLNGYFTIKNNSDAAMKVQMALDRMSLELQDISAVSAALPNPISILTPDTLITYTNSLGANRAIGFAGSNIYLATTTGNVLIDNIDNFQVNAVYGNVYGVAANDVVCIDIGFTMHGHRSFSTRIFPRNRIPHPP
jgi:prepilin-type N-terminal cleavage/methylation domain-containing protein